MLGRPSFAEIPYQVSAVPSGREQWTAALEKEHGKPIGEIVWDTMERIPVKPLSNKG